VPQPAAAAAGDVPGAANAAAQPAAAVTPRQDVIVGSDVMRLTFDSEGGTLKLPSCSSTPTPWMTRSSCRCSRKRQARLPGSDRPDRRQLPRTRLHDRDARRARAQGRSGQRASALRVADQGGVKLVKTFTSSAAPMPSMCSTMWSTPARRREPPAVHAAGA
jgi:YidC/Oxa1 family membrane protein insertase